MIWVPPGGAAAVNQQTPAAKASMGMLRQVRATRSRSGKKAKKRYARNKRILKGPKKKKASGGRKLKFGSPAWRKKYMKK
jgi:hypothetical protein